MVTFVIFFIQIFLLSFSYCILNICICKILLIFGRIRAVPYSALVKAESELVGAVPYKAAHISVAQWERFIPVFYCVAKMYRFCFHDVLHGFD